MLRSSTCALLALLLAVAIAPRAIARDVEGVQVPDSITVAGAPLALNGAGYRRATMFNVKVYVGALYLAERSRDPSAVVTADAPKSVHMRFVRDVGKDKVMDAFREGFQKNSGADAKALAPGLDRVATVIPPELKKGMKLDVTYVPGQGTIVTGPAGEVTIPGKPFADAMFRNWFGPHPADDGLENAMLGR
jgi:Chalcone isomerase-like